jgi:hypothetical protein
MMSLQLTDTVITVKCSAAIIETVWSFVWLGLVREKT